MLSYTYTINGQTVRGSATKVHVRYTSRKTSIVLENDQGVEYQSLELGLAHKPNKVSSFTCERFHLEA